MAEPSFSRRARERVTLPYPPPRVEAEVMDGRWFRTNEKPQWIERLEIDTERVSGETYIRIFGSQSPSPADWGRVRCDAVFANACDTANARAGGLVAHYDFDDMHVEVQANYNLGLLVVATFVEFRAAGALSDRFTREFFFRGDAA